MIKSFGEFAVRQVEKDLKRYCLKHWGVWWASSFFMNKAAREVYDKLRGCSMAIAIQAIAKDDPDYQKYVDIHEQLISEFKKDDKIWLKK